MLAVQAQSTSDPFGVADFDCSRVEELGIEKQGNLRAAAILRYCKEGITGVNLPQSSETLIDIAYSRPSSVLAFGGPDINVITGTETSPTITQAESVAWGHGNTVVIPFDDSRGRTLTPASYCGVSVSTDAGSTFTRLGYTFNTTGTCFGDPSVFYSVRAGKWFIGFFAGRCNTNFGQWESTDGINWTESGCYVSGSGISGDWLSTWVDNNPASPYYGRQYAAYNNFNVGGGRIEVVYSTDDGVNFSSPIGVTTGFERANKVFGSLGTDGTVFVQAMNEGGGGLGMRTNIIYRSTNGGANWTPVIQGGAFLGAGLSTSGYYACMYPSYWRYMSSGQPGVGPGGVVHYVYASHGVGADPGNIMYIRSTNNGSSWSTPIQLNGDTPSGAQWQPSLAVNARGKMMVTWFDNRNNIMPAGTDTLERFGRASLDNGLTWGVEMPVSASFRRPLQPDPGIQPAYVGDRHDAAFSNDNYGNVAYDTWTDGRVLINGSPQQDVFFDKINFGGAGPADFDGDGKSDLSIFRPSVGQWFYQKSSDGVVPGFQFGVSTDKIVPGDYTGDGKTDIAIWRPSNGFWFILRSEDFLVYGFPFGTDGDVPVPGDYDGDGKTDAAVFRPSTVQWFINKSSGGVTFHTFGAIGDKPVVADYDGDGKTDIAIYRPSVGEWWYQRSSDGIVPGFQFGSSTDKPVQGDYTGDGKADIAFWRPSTGFWYVLRSEDFLFYGFPWGLSTDVPAPGDFDGDGKMDASVFRPADTVWYINRSTAGVFFQQFGISTDLPVPSAFVP
jgi:hypothetical protein